MKKSCDTSRIDWPVFEQKCGFTRNSLLFLGRMIGSRRLRSMSAARTTPGAIPFPDDRLSDQALYINREISWLSFNRRVLEEARDPAWPLLERFKFLGIFYSNLDEFFMIRVSGLPEQLEAAITERSPDGLSASQQLEMIREIVRTDLAAASDLLRSELLRELQKAGIQLLSWEEIDSDRRRHLTRYFENVVFPVLTPLAFDPAHPFPSLPTPPLLLPV